MKIRNCLIITDDDSELRMSIDELRDFTGNVVFSQSNLTRALTATAAREMNGVSTEPDSAPTDRGRVAVKKKRVLSALSH